MKGHSSLCNVSLALMDKMSSADAHLADEMPMKTAHACERFTDWTVNGIMEESATWW